MPYHSSKLFTYDHETNSFTAWVSELGTSPFGPVFNDAIDVGCSIVSDKTGKIADFFVNNTEKDAEGDTLAWHLLPTNATKQLFPLLRNSSVTVFNT